MHNFYDEAKGPGAQSIISVTPGTSAYFEVRVYWNKTCSIIYSCEGSFEV
jgi:hypothetical protein